MRIGITTITKSFLEKHYTSSTQRFLLDSGWVFFGNLVIAGSAFITTVVLTRILSAEQFGIYRFVLAFIPILAISTLPNMGPSLTRAVARGLYVNISKIVIEKIRWGTIGSLVAITIALYYFLNDNSQLGMMFIIIALYIPFFDTFLIYKSLLHGSGNFMRAAIFQSISRFVLAMGVVVTALITKHLLWIIVSYFLFQIVAQTIFFTITHRQKNTRPNSKHDEIIKYGKNLTLIGVLNTVAANVDKLLVWHFLGAEVLALYIIATLLAVEISRIGDTFGSVLLQRFSTYADQINNESAKLLKKLLIFGCCLLLLGVTTATLIPFIFPILFPAYISAIPLAQVSCLLILFLPMNTIMIQFFVAHKQKKILTISAFGKMVIFIFVVLLFYSSIGLWAAVLAAIAKEAGVFAYHIYMITFRQWESEANVLNE